MPSLRKTVLSMIGVLAVSSCANGGKVLLCPAQETTKLRPLPSEKLDTPTFEQRAWQRGFEMAPKQTPGSAGSSEN